MQIELEVWQAPSSKSSFQLHALRLRPTPRCYSELEDTSSTLGLTFEASPCPSRCSSPAIVIYWRQNHANLCDQQRNVANYIEKTGLDLVTSIHESISKLHQQ